MVQKDLILDETESLNSFTDFNPPKNNFEKIFKFFNYINHLL